VKTWSFYDPISGEFAAKTWAGPESDLADNTPSDLATIEGRHDRRNRRVEKGQVVAYQPPQPSPDHEWRADVELWVLTQDAIEARAKDLGARAALEDIDLRSIRRLRELSSDPILVALEADAVNQRADLIDTASDSKGSPVSAGSEP